MLHGRIPAHTGKRDELLAVLSESSSTPMPGCRLYVISLDESDPDAVWVSEIWESEALQRSALELDFVRERIARANPLIDREGMSQQRLDSVAGLPRTAWWHDPAHPAK